MANYRQSVNTARTHFTRAPQGELEFSTIYTPHTLLTTFNAGEIVPILCEEALPHDTWSLALNAIIRQSTLIAPTMGQLYADFYAFFVPNRIVNHSWKNVMGENTSGMWTAPQVSLATLAGPSTSSVKIPVGSVADYYGYPTQSALRSELLQQMHDLKFRGYLEIYNTYFRDENYQPPIPYSKLNVFNGFLSYNVGSDLSAKGDKVYNLDVNGVESDGSFGEGAVVKALAGDGGSLLSNGATLSYRRKVAWSALQPPLKANKFHDYFTSCLPDSQKGRAVTIPIFGQVNLNTSAQTYAMDNPIKFGATSNSNIGTRTPLLFLRSDDQNALNGYNSTVQYATASGTSYSPNTPATDSVSIDVNRTNLYADLNNSGIEISIDQLRISSAMQQVYEILGRSGSRYTEYVTAFFGIETENPFDDIPTYLGHFRRELDLYQTAQTSASGGTDSPSTPQGNLTAYGFTDKGGHLFTNTFVEHGYVHVFCVVRHKNVYSSYLGRDNFRLSMMDFYQYPLANISEQPVYTREINPFRPESDEVFGYQEAWAEYRFSPDRCSGQFRSQPASQAQYDLTEWNYVDTYDYNLVASNGSWLQSNTAEVVARTTAIQDREFPQFKAQFVFNCKKERPMPTYSVSGLDII